MSSSIATALTPVEPYHHAMGIAVREKRALSNQDHALRMIQYGSDHTDLSSSSVSTISDRCADKRRRLDASACIPVADDSDEMEVSSVASSITASIATSTGVSAGVGMESYSAPRMVTTEGTQTILSSAGKPYTLPVRPTLSQQQQQYMALMKFFVCKMKAIAYYSATIGNSPPPGLAELIAFTPAEQQELQTNPMLVKSATKMVSAYNIYSVMETIIALLQTDFKNVRLIMFFCQVIRYQDSLGVLTMPEYHQEVVDSYRLMMKLLFVFITKFYSIADPHRQLLQTLLKGWKTLLQALLSTERKKNHLPVGSASTAMTACTALVRSKEVIGQWEDGEVIIALFHLFIKDDQMLQHLILIVSILCTAPSIAPTAYVRIAGREWPTMIHASLWQHGLLSVFFFAISYFQSHSYLVRVMLVTLNQFMESIPSSNVPVTGSAMPSATQFSTWSSLLINLLDRNKADTKLSLVLWSSIHHLCRLFGEPMRHGLYAVDVIRYLVNVVTVNIESNIKHLPMLIQCLQALSALCPPPAESPSVSAASWQFVSRVPMICFPLPNNHDDYDDFDGNFGTRKKMSGRQRYGYSFRRDFQRSYQGLDCLIRYWDFLVARTIRRIHESYLKGLETIGQAIVALIHDCPVNCDVLINQGFAEKLIVCLKEICLKEAGVEALSGNAGGRHGKRSLSTGSDKEDSKHYGNQQAFQQSSVVQSSLRLMEVCCEALLVLNRHYLDTSKYDREMWCDADGRSTSLGKSAKMEVENDLDPGSVAIEVIMIEAVADSPLSDSDTVNDTRRIASLPVREDEERETGYPLYRSMTSTDRPERSSSCNASVCSAAPSVVTSVDHLSSSSRSSAPEVVDDLSIEPSEASIPMISVASNTASRTSSSMSAVGGLPGFLAAVAKGDFLASSYGMDVLLQVLERRKSSFRVVELVSALLSMKCGGGSTSPHTSSGNGGFGIRNEHFNSDSVDSREICRTWLTDDVSFINAGNSLFLTLLLYLCGGGYEVAQNESVEHFTSVQASLLHLLHLLSLTLYASFTQLVYSYLLMLPTHLFPAGTAVFAYAMSQSMNKLGLLDMLFYFLAIYGSGQGSFKEAAQLAFGLAVSHQICDLLIQLVEMLESWFGNGAGTTSSSRSRASSSSAPAPTPSAPMDEVVNTKRRRAWTEAIYSLCSLSGDYWNNKPDVPTAPPDSSTATQQAPTDPVTESAPQSVADKSVLAGDKVLVEKISRLCAVFPLQAASCDEGNEHWIRLLSRMKTVLQTINQLFHHSTSMTLGSALLRESLSVLRQMVSRDVQSVVQLQDELWALTRSLIISIQNGSSSDEGLWDLLHQCTSVLTAIAAITGDTSNKHVHELLSLTTIITTGKCTSECERQANDHDRTLTASLLVLSDLTELAFTGGQRGASAIVESVPSIGLVHELLIGKQLLHHWCQQVMTLSVEGDSITATDRQSILNQMVIEIVLEKIFVFCKLIKRTSVYLSSNNTDDALMVMSWLEALNQVSLCLYDNEYGRILQRQLFALTGMLRETLEPPVELLPLDLEEAVEFMDEAGFGMDEQDVPIEPIKIDNRTANRSFSLCLPLSELENDYEDLLC